MKQKYAERNIALAEALESGEYKQTTDHLRDETGFCCLGVACDLYKKATRKGKWTKDLSFQLSDDWADSQTPPSTIAAWYGWDSVNPDLLVAKRDGTASEHNDDYGRTFKQIAKGFRRLAKEFAKKVA